MNEVSEGRSVELRYDGGTHRLPVFSGTEGEEAIELKTLLGSTGMVTLDPGFGNTAACRSEITYIDGDAGILRYRGYPIEQLAEGATFAEVCHLLVHGELPTPEQLDELTARLRDNAAIPAGLRDLIAAFPVEAHPMASLSGAVNMLAAFHADACDPADPAQVDEATIRLLAQLPTVAAQIHRRATGQDVVEPDPSLGYVENFLNMTFGPTEGGVDPLLVRAMDLLFILHADHELNCSTATVRVVGSSQADLFASIAAGVNALSGPLHGGANQAVLEMLEGIQRVDGDVDSFIKKVKDRESKTRLMGFGHRVYKNFDPRSKQIKKLAQQILSRQEGEDRLFELALQLEEHALSDQYFVDRKLYPNVDFYTGLIYRAMGFPTNMFTVLFAIGRLPGWIAHWRELRNDPAARIARPRQLYVGPKERAYPGRS
ncbi:citrate synthase [Marinactinospora thermotolerans]|uniref:Citrate synthase n=1 Tax=Marinactinospora thermotolerans DSM 45154 TaxID=1122192 RepID=A0A1T4T2Q6_9ACTN|nr:citrate synthase [Marinactinospora thermotolerans]SKA34765.1 citrate synthase [Marinactinospora thermotolerans DSM 45154]